MRRKTKTILRFSTETSEVVSARRIRKLVAVEQDEQIRSIRAAETIDLSWCPICQANVRMRLAEQAVATMHQTLRELFRLIEGGRIHSIETDSGQTLVCLDSWEKRG
ncbi:MAG: hypothetical protein AB7J13_15790 [Pyrinomonadaceae bacterium]